MFISTCLVFRVIYFDVLLVGVDLGLRPLCSSIDSYWFASTSQPNLCSVCLIVTMVISMVFQQVMSIHLAGSIPRSPLSLYVCIIVVFSLWSCVLVYQLIQSIRCFYQYLFIYQTVFAQSYPKHRPSLSNLSQASNSLWLHFPICCLLISW